MSSQQSAAHKRRPRPLNEETIEAVRRRIGIPVRRSPRSHNRVSSTDSFRHFAHSYGDDNPLYCDPDYARASTWASPIAPPLYPISAGIRRPATWSEAEEKEMAGGDPLAGIGQYLCGERWLFVEPIRAGDVLWQTQCLHAAALKSSRFGGGVGALVSHRYTWENEEGAPFALRFQDFWHADREKSGEAGKYRNIERTRFSDDDLERIDASYEAETTRGADPRLAKDVRAGDELGPIVKGPLCVTDVICWHVGNGMGYYGVAALKLGYQNRRRVPKFYQKNELGFWDAAQRCHWEDSWAQQMGQPAAYDYGAMRTAWMVHLVTNWMGDAGWLWKLSCSARKFNYLGDVHFVSGAVRAVDPATSAVTIDIQAVNQRGEATAQAEAVVLLPPAEGGSVRIPDFDLEDVPEATGP